MPTVVKRIDIFGDGETDATNGDWESDANGARNACLTQDGFFGTANNGDTKTLHSSVPATWPSASSDLYDNWDHGYQEAGTQLIYDVDGLDDAKTYTVRVGYCDTWVGGSIEFDIIIQGVLELDGGTTTDLEVNVLEVTGVSPSSGVIEIKNGTANNQGQPWMALEVIEEDPPNAPSVLVTGTASVFAPSPSVSATATAAATGGAVTFVDSGTAIWETGFESPGTTDIPLDYSGDAVGDVAVMVCRSVNSPTPISTPSGWTQLYEGAQGGTRMGVFWRVLDGTEGPTVTVTFTGVNVGRGGQVFVYTDVDTSPVADTSGNISNTAGVDSTRDTYAGTLPTVESGDAILYVTTAEQDPSPTVPTGTTLRSATTGNLFLYAAEIAGLESAPAIDTWDSYTGNAGQDAQCLPVLLKAAPPGGFVATSNVFSPSPSVSATASPGLVAGSSAVFSPTLSAATTAAPGLVSGSSVVFAPAPGVSATAEPGLVSGTSQVFSPSTIASPEPISGTSEVFAPAISAGQSAAAGLVTGAATVLAPSPQALTSTTVEPGVVAGQATVFAPSPVTFVAAGPGLVSATSQVFAPGVLIGQAAAAGPVAATSQVFTPAVAFSAAVSAALVAAAATVFGPQPARGVAIATESREPGQVATASVSGGLRTSSSLGAARTSSSTEPDRTTS